MALVHLKTWIKAVTVFIYECPVELWLEYLHLQLKVAGSNLPDPEVDFALIFFMFGIHCLLALFQ